VLIAKGPDKYQIAGLTAAYGDILERQNPGSLIGHRFLLGYDGAIAHVPSMSDVFRYDRLEDVLTPGAQLRIIYPSRSREESELRFARANQIMGVAWWDMNCHQTMDFVAGLPQNPWAT